MGIKIKSGEHYPGHFGVAGGQYADKMRAKDREASKMTLNTIALSASAKDLAAMLVQTMLLHEEPPLVWDEVQTLVQKHRLRG